MSPGLGARPPELEPLRLVLRLLFDLETALESVHQASAAYPTTVEFQLEEEWELRRAALEAAFSWWEYASDGTTYRLSGEADGRRFDIGSPS